MDLLLSPHWKQHGLVGWMDYDYTCRRSSLKIHWKQCSLKLLVEFFDEHVTASYRFRVINFEWTKTQER
jgi:hypothetical protein